RREDEMLDAEVAARLEDVEKAVDVARRIRVRIDQRVAHAGLRGEMDHALRLHLFEEAIGRVAIGEIELLETEARAGREQLAQTRFFQRDVVVAIEAVDADDSVAALEQTARHMRSDETGGAGDDDHRTAFGPFGVRTDV